MSDGLRSPNIVVYIIAWMSDCVNLMLYLCVDKECVFALNPSPAICWLAGCYSGHCGGLFRWIRVTKVVEWGVGLINAQRPVITHLGQNWLEFYLN